MRVNSNILFHPSSVGELMTEPKEKSNYEKWQDACTQLGKTKSDYDAISNKETKTAIKKREKIEELERLASQLEQIKDEVTLSDTCKKRLVKVFVELKYGRSDDLDNRYIKKGLQTEEDCITLYSRIKKQVFFKNESYLINDFLIGTPDFGDNKEILKSKVIIDTKSCWDLFTFWNAKTSDINKAYYWQLQSYMALTGATKGVIAYCLINTPDALIYDEKRKLQWKMGVINPDNDKDYIKACEEIDKNLTYDDIPMEERMFEVEIPRNDSDIERLYERIKQCREYMNRHFFSDI